MIKEQTLIIIKPEAIQRHLIGEIIKRFEMKGLQLVAMKMVRVNKDILLKHYSDDPEYLKGSGQRTIDSQKARGIELEKSALEVGLATRSRLVGFWENRVVICMIWQGLHSIALCRKIVGHTNPEDAMPGTIRGDFTTDSYSFSDTKDRPVRNLVHASGNKAEAENEIKIWFKESEIFDYPLHSDELLYGDNWGR